MTTYHTKMEGNFGTVDAEKWYGQMISDLKSQNADTLQIDCKDLSYISSEGIRKLLMLYASNIQICCTEVQEPVYEILDETGLTKIMNIQKIPRKVEISGAQFLARGTVGAVYKLDDDKVIKLFNPNITLDMIERERQYAQTVLLLGIPTTISYDVVQANDSYGIVYEMAGYQTFSQTLRNNMDQFDTLSQKYVSLLKKINQTPVEHGQLPGIKEIYHEYIDRADYLEPSERESLHLLVDNVPEQHTMVHGDFHANNIMFRNNEMILIDLGDISEGHPIFDLAGMYVSHVLVGSYRPDFIQKGMGIDYDTCLELWNIVLHHYFSEETENLEQKEQLIRQFAFMKICLMYVLAPGVENELDWTPLEDARRELFPNIEELITKLKKDDFVERRKMEKTVVSMGSFNPLTYGHLHLFDLILEVNPCFHLFVRYNEGVDLTDWETKKGWFDRVNEIYDNRIILHKLTTDQMKGKQYDADIFTNFIHIFEDELGTSIDEVWVGEDATELIEKSRSNFPNIKFVITRRDEINSTAVRNDLEGHKDWIPSFVYADLKDRKEKQ